MHIPQREALLYERKFNHPETLQVIGDQAVGAADPHPGDSRPDLHHSPKGDTLIEMISPILDPEDYFGLLAHDLSRPLAGEDLDEPIIRTPKPLRTGEDYWEGYRNPSGRVCMASKKAMRQSRNWQKPRRKA